MATQEDDKAAPATPLLRDWTSWIMILTFCLSIAMPAVVQLSGYNNAANENRTLAAPPRWPMRMSDLVKLPQDTQTYLDDRFGLRNQLIRLNSLLRYMIDVSTTPNVVIGRHKFLFYAYEPERLMEQHTGEDVFTPESLDAWINAMAENNAWLAARGIAYYVVIAPDKSTIYPEDIPDYPRLPNSTTRLDQVVAALANRTDITLIDPRESIETLKATHPMYRRDDSHWAPRGAFVAYRLLVDRIRQRFPNVRPVSLDDYDITQAPQHGDLANSLNLYEDLLSVEDQFQFRGKSHLLSTSQIPGSPPWGWLVKKMRTNLQDKPKILIQGDSFTDYVMGPLFMYETFKDPVYTHHNGSVLNKTLIEETHPDIVVLELAERYLAIP